MILTFRYGRNGAKLDNVGVPEAFLDTCQCGFDVDVGGRPSRLSQPGTRTLALRRGRFPCEVSGNGFTKLWVWNHTLWTRILNYTPMTSRSATPFDGS